MAVLTRASCGRQGTVVIFVIVMILAAECGRERDQTLTRTVKDAASTFGNAAKKFSSNAWRAGKDTLSGMLSEGKGALGPDPQSKSCLSDGESCNDGGCPADQENCPSSKEGDQPQSKSCSSDGESCNDGGCPADQENCPSSKEGDPPTEERDGVLQDEQFDLSVINEDDVGFFGQIMDIASTGVSTVYRTAKSTVYDRGARLIKNFSETVRTVVGEELHTFLKASLNSLGASLLTPGATLYTLGQTAMTVSLVLLCLLLSYLFFSRLSFIVLIGLNATVFLLHQLMGPKWIFEWIFEMCSQCVNVGMLMWAYPISSSIILALLFVYSVVFPFVKWLTQKTPAQKMTDLTECVLDISTRLEALETRQTKVFEEVERRQNEILDILKRLDAKKKK